MSLKKFVINITVVTLVFVVFAIVLSGFVTYADTIVLNHLAIGQLENDDTSWMFVELYNGVGRSIINVLTFIVTGSYLLYLIINSIKYYRYRRNENNEKIF